MAGIFHLKYNHSTKLYLTENFPNCRDVAQAGFNKSGIFNINVPGKPKILQIYCDFETDGGDWMVSFICVLPNSKS